VAIEDRVAELGAAVDAYADETRRHREFDNERFERLEAAVAELRAAVRRLAQVVADSNAALIRTMRQGGAGEPGRTEKSAEDANAKAEKTEAAEKTEEKRPRRRWI
jgi:hypothetical protein